MNMTIDGTYKVTVKTPLGPQQGQLVLKTDGTSLSGVLQNPKGENAFEGGTVEGNTVCFVTRIRTPMGRLKAEITGEIAGNSFTGTAKLPLGNAEISATRL